DGAFNFLAHTGADELTQLSDLANDELWDAGIRTDSVTEYKYYKSDASVPMGVKRFSPTFCGIARIGVDDRPLSVMDRIAKDQFGESAPFVGASHVSGKRQLLVELGAESFD